MTDANKVNQTTLNPRQTRLTTWVGMDSETADQTTAAKIMTDSVSLITVDEFFHRYMSGKGLMASDYLYGGVKEIRRHTYRLMESNDAVSYGFSGFMLIKKDKLIALYGKQVDKIGGSLPLALAHKANELFNAELFEYSAFMHQATAP